MERSAPYEQELAGALVSATDAVAVGISRHVDRVTPTIDTVRDLAYALSTLKLDDYKPKDPNAPSAAAGMPAKPADKDKVDAAAATPTKAPQAAVQEREDFRLQVAINEAVAAAANLSRRTNAGRAPDFSGCVPYPEEAAVMAPLPRPPASLPANAPWGG